MNFSVHQSSHIGNRKYNQDRVAYAYCNDKSLLVLADGMGGHLHGELAAGLAIDIFIQNFEQTTLFPIADPQAFLADTMRAAHQNIMKLPYEKERGGLPGTTCVAALIQDGQLYWGHAGDSRLYLLRDGVVLTKTRDHSMVQQWFDWGMISAEEMRIHPQRNQITNCLGGVEDMFYMEPGETVGLKSGDVLLLGSDGLWSPFTDDELVNAFAAEPVEKVLDNLIMRALEREADNSDNITGLALRWGDAEAAHDTDKTVNCILEIK